MSIVRVGTNKKYADNWANIFSGKKSAASAGNVKGKRPVVKAPVKMTAKKSAKKKTAKR